MKKESTIQIRQAVREDTASMMALIRELAVFENEPDAVMVSEDHFAESGFGPKPVWWALVAVIPASDGKPEQIVGFALYYIRYSTWKGQRMYLEDLIVTEEWRGKGIGTQLMDALIAEASSRKFSGMMWQVLDWNEPAINFYRKYNAAFHEDWVNVSLEL
jgi:ribosomal protein S18 acetylase RimI-like enzyme